MPAPITSLLGAANQISVNNADPLNPVVTLANPVTFATDLTVPGTLSCNGCPFPSFSNVLTNLTVPGPSFLFASNTGFSNFSWQGVNPLPATQTVNFSFGGATFSVNCTYSQNDNLGVIKMLLTALNNNVSFVAYGIPCDATTATFSSTTSLTNFPTPSYWSSGDRILIGQLPIASINATTHIFQTYYIGDVYLYNNAGSPQIQFTLGGNIGSTSGLMFQSGTNYSFGYINTTFADFGSIVVPSCKVASYSYMIA